MLREREREYICREQAVTPAFKMSISHLRVPSLDNQLRLLTTAAGQWGTLGGRSDGVLEISCSEVLTFT